MILEKFSLAGEFALVTGTSSGLGQAMTIALAEAGADVACHSRKDGGAANAIAAIERLGRKAVNVAGDLADKTAPSNIVEQTLEAFGRIDILINNAGMIRRSPAVDFAGSDWDEVIEVNLSSIFRLSQATGRLMVEQGS